MLRPREGCVGRTRAMRLAGRQGQLIPGSEELLKSFEKDTIVRKISPVAMQMDCGMKMVAGGHFNSSDRR